MSTRKFTFPAALAAIMVFVGPALAAQHSTSSSALPATLRPALYQGLAKNAGPAYAIGRNGTRIRIAVSDANAAYPLTVDPLVWIEQEVIPDSDDLNGNDFGVNVAVSGNTAIGGTPFMFINPNYDQGSAYVYNRSGGSWSLAQQLFASDGTVGDHFGSSVAIDGNTALVGAPSKTVAGHVYRGAAYIFTRSNGTWTQAAELFSPYPLHQERFGTAVAILGHVMLIAAPGDGVHGAGCVYAYVKSDGSWTPAKRLTASDGSPGDGFGDALVLSWSGALVGAPGAGAAYFYSDSGGTVQETKLTPSDGMAGDMFGATVALNGATAVVGAPWLTVNGHLYEGAAYVFTQTGGAWSQTQKLIPPSADEAKDDTFGDSLSISRQSLLVGAAGESVQGQDSAGAGYLFTGTNGSWTLKRKFVASDPGFADSLGASAAVDDSGIIWGAPNAAQWSVGAFYFYDWSDLALNVSAPDSVAQGSDYTSQAIVTNDSATASPALAVEVAVPAGASFVSASATQGSCAQSGGVVTCAFGQVAGGGGTAMANVTLKATGNPGDTIENTADVSMATPALTASAPTQITQSP